MFKRDNKGLKEAVCARAVFVYVDLLTGRIVGTTRFDKTWYNDVCSSGELQESRVERMLVKDYKYLTDDKRPEAKIVTAGDLYDNVEWTTKGFVIGDCFLKINENSEIRDRHA